MKKILIATNLRDAAWFSVGINTGLRISAVLALRLGDVRRTKTQWQDRIVVVEHKTGKRKDFPLNASVKQIVGTYLATRPEAVLSDPLFPSRSGGGGPPTGSGVGHFASGGPTCRDHRPHWHTHFAQDLWLLGLALRGRFSHHPRFAESQQPRHDFGLHRHSPRGSRCGVFGAEFVRFTVRIHPPMNTCQD